MVYRVCTRAIMSCALLCISFVPTPLLAQSNTTGYIYGQVGLEKSQPASLAIVTITNAQTGQKRAISTRKDGSFRFAALPIGSYSILIESSGYTAVEDSEIIVRVGTGTNATASLIQSQTYPLKLETLSVIGSKISAIDVSSTESTTILNMETIEHLPVSRNPAGVALLAPGTTLGDQQFGNYVSFGGASVAENAFYINGMDVTNFRNGLGGSSVPFEFYQEFQVKTGGYGAEFGRSTGGVVNSVTKRGGNEWTFGAGAYYEPDAWRETSPDVKSKETSENFLDYMVYNSGTELDVLDVHGYASGPIIKNHLYFYALVQQNSTETAESIGSASLFGFKQVEIDHSDDDNTFWGIKLDWQISPDHQLEFTAFSDKFEQGKVLEGVDFSTGSLELVGTGFTHRGGENYILRYTGYFGERLTLSAMAGFSEYDRTDRSDADDVPVTFDFRDNAPTFFPTPWVNFFTGVSVDEREMYRFDGELDLDNHLLRFGMDYQQNTSDDLTTYSGGVHWRYYSVVPGEPIQGIEIPEGTTQVVRERIDRQSGGFEVENTAFYIEDHWHLNDSLVIYAGLRNETFDNKNAIGQTFVKMDNQIAPRLGISWDLKSDGTSKLFATAGRYHLAMPTTVNISLSGASFSTEEWFVLNNLNPDGTPDKGDSYFRIVYADGEIPNIDELLDRNLEPSYQDEVILGYVFEPAPGWSLGIRGIYRDLKQAIEDVDMSDALNAYAAENDYDDFYAPFLGAYILTNPGSNAQLRIDLDFDGIAENFVLSADSIGVPKVDRTYKAIELFFERPWKGKWFAQGSYTYSESRGNYEGWTRSDIGQSNAALTASFDTPEFTEGSNGKLPNDRPHTLKLFGAWEFVNKWQASGSFLFQSGRPYGAIGPHPNLPPFIQASFYDHGELVPRGSRGRTPELYNLNLGLKFTQALGWHNGRFQVSLDVFNVFDADTETALNENVQKESGETSLNYLLPRNFQPPRSVRLSARVDF